MVHQCPAPPKPLQYVLHHLHHSQYDLSADHLHHSLYDLSADHLHHSLYDLSADHPCYWQFCEHHNAGQCAIVLGQTLTDTWEFYAIHC